MLTLIGLYRENYNETNSLFKKLNKIRPPSGCTGDSEYYHMWRKIGLVQDEGENLVKLMGLDDQQAAWLRVRFC